MEILLAKFFLQNTDNRKTKLLHIINLHLYLNEKTSAARRVIQYIRIMKNTRVIWIVSQKVMHKSFCSVERSVSQAICEN